MIAVSLLALQAAAARGGLKNCDDAEPGELCDDDAPKAPPAATPEDGVERSRYYPPPVDGPALRLPESPTRLYLDGAYAISDDLTALPFIVGKGRNIRAALGGAWRWRRFTLEGQLPVNVTTLDVTQVLNMMLLNAEDRHQTRVSLGDLTLGAIWTERLVGDSEALIAGLGLRGRLATHTTRFQFHLMDGTLADFVIPYYFHIEPTLILGGALGPFTYVMNQGVKILLGPDADFDTEHIVVPSLYFYDAHYAIGVAPWSFLGASVEVATTIQLNHLSDPNFSRLNNLRAVWVAPALQVHLGDYRVDLIARLGLTRGQELLGVFEYVGTHSFTLRATRYF
jgi:hypothetical protein